MSTADARRQRARLRRRSGAAVAILFSGAAIAACGSGRPIENAHSAPADAASVHDFGTQAGYVWWRRRLSSVGASWSVPGIGASSPRGHASTWVGAQEGFGGARPFIQVGTTEDAEASSTLPGHTRYEAFWTDLAHEFEPIYLFPVTPLTRVKARLALSHGRWTIEIRDLESGRQARLTTAQEGRASFRLGLWLQEDVGPRARPAPYPAIELTSFHDLTVNGAEPHTAELHSQWMTERGVDLGPSAFAHGSFAIAPVALSRPGARYLQIAETVVLGLTAFEGRRQRWTSSTPRWQLSAASSALVAALTRNIAELEHSAWPAAAQGAIGSLAARTAALAAIVRAVPATAGAELAAWESRLAAGSRARSTAVEQVRRALGVPEVAG